MIPEHYAGGIDVIEFIREQRGVEAAKEFCLGNIIKYSTRYGRKDKPLKEAIKIADYAERLRGLEQFSFSNLEKIQKEGLID